MDFMLKLSVMHFSFENKNAKRFMNCFRLVFLPVDVLGITPLPFGQPVPISYDDSSTRMIAIFFGFICFFLLSAFIMFLWWPIRDAKIGQGDR